MAHGYSAKRLAAYLDAFVDDLPDTAGQRAAVTILIPAHQLPTETNAGAGSQADSCAGAGGVVAAV
jgi:hypothetical protein